MINSVIFMTSMFYKVAMSETGRVHGIRPSVTLDLRSNSPFISQVHTRQFGRRI